MADRERYDGPLRAGMVITGRDNDGVLGFRRDLLLGPHPLKTGIWIYEALPCRMRRRIGSGVGEIGTCPELNIRMIMQPEESDGATEAPDRTFTLREVQAIVALSATGDWERLTDAVPQEVWDDLHERGLVTTQSHYPGGDAETGATAEGIAFVEAIVRG